MNLKGMLIITGKEKVPKPCFILSDSLKSLLKEGLENELCPVLCPLLELEQLPEFAKDQNSKKQRRDKQTVS